MKKSITTIFLLLSFSLGYSQNSNDVVKEQVNKGVQNYLATYFGGNAIESCWGIALDEAGNVYVTGLTTSPDFPVAKNSVYPTPKGKGDAFVLKFDKELKTVLASARIGGSEDECAYSILYDKRGYVYVAGYTASKDFPTTQSAYNEKYKGGNGDAFILKMDSELKTLVASTFIGGSGDENDFRSPGIVQDNNGNIYMAGITNSVDFPATTGAYSEKYNGGTMDMFLSKFDSDLKSLIASTFLGGNNDDRMGRSLVIDKKKNELIVAGYTVSLNFPLTPNAYSKSISGELDGFVAKFSTDLSELTASTMLNGWIYSMFIHENGDIYVGGHGKPTTTSKAYCQFSEKGNDQGFISRFSNDLSKLKSSTLLPGSFHSNAGEINSLNLAQDSKGNIISTGLCAPKDFPTTPGASDETQNGGSDTYILKMNQDLSKLLTSSFIGGSKNERWNRMATDKDGNIYIASYTLSTDFPTSKGSASEKFNGGGNDGFIVSINNNLLSDDFEEFHDAAKRDNLKKVKQLLGANGKLIEKNDRYKRTALHSAARYGALSVVNYLLEKGANVNAKDESGNTPLHLASIYSYDQVADLLLSQNADINALNDDGLKPLYFATYYGTSKMMGLLLSKNADTGKQDKEGNTILHIAVLFRNAEKIMEILKYNQKVDVANNVGSTPLHFAVRDDKNEKLVTVLIENGADPSIMDSTGKNALYFTGPFDTLISEFLLKKGVKINSQDKDGNTVLHNSLQTILNVKNFDPQAGQRMKDKLKLFVEYGADPNIKNDKDKTPMDLANEIGDKELVELLNGQK